MRIVRGPRPADSFTLISNEAARDAALSFRALGILTRVIGAPPDSHFTSRSLAEEGPGREGRDAVQTALRELKAGGYLVERRWQDEKGHWRSEATITDWRIPSTGAWDSGSGWSGAGSSGPVVPRTRTEELPLSSDVGSAAVRPDDLERFADAIEACELLAELMVANGCKRPVITKAWITDMDKIVRLDGREWPKVQNAIRWSQGDSFWMANIHSPAKLRSKYDQLRLAAQRTTAEAGPKLNAVIEECVANVLGAVRSNGRTRRPDFGQSLEQAVVDDVGWMRICTLSEYDATAAIKSSAARILRQPAPGKEANAT